ncbi:MAG: tetratricopeptide repeat protein, partial [Myxococcales bacterium]|nr:tetratricopeptide repeat protein [Myxococcales bacterium]
GRAALLLEVFVEHDEQGRLEEVAAIGKEAARLEPAQAPYVAAGAIARIPEGAAAEGLALLVPVLEREPEAVEALIAQARSYMALEDVAKAFLSLEAARKARPGDHRPALFEGRFNHKLGKFSDARQALLRAQKLAATSSPLPSIELGRFDLDAGDVEAALEQAKTAVSISPLDARAHVLIADCLEQRGELDEALASYRRAHALDEESVDAALGEANMLREQAARSRVPAETEELAAALPLYRAVMERAPKNPKVMFEHGRALEMQGDLPAALELYREAANLDANDVRPHLRMAAAHLEAEPPSIEEAKAAMDAALRIEHESGRQRHEVRFWEARLAHARGEYSAAIANMRQAVEKEPRNALYNFWLGKSLDANNSLYEAIASYEAAIRLNSRFAEAQRALGWTELERHRFKQARKWFARYKKSEPSDLSIHVDIGESFIRQNKDGKAMAEFEKALAYDSQNVQALLHMGNIASRRGDDRKASKYFEKIVERAPDHGEAWCLLALSRAQPPLSSEAKTALRRCVENATAPADLQESAQNVLDTAGL